MKTSTSFRQKFLALFAFSIIANHLTDIDNFPFSPSYSFPIFSILSTIAIGALILVVTELNFRWFKKNYFSNQLDIRCVTYFILSSLGYIILLYIPLYFLINWLDDEDFEIYYLFVGLSLTLLLSIIVIGILYAKDIYNLHKLDAISGKLIIQKDGKKILVPYTDISYFYTENKIVYLVKLDGSTVITDFTLNEMESKFSKQLFFRTNRQTFVHMRAISKVEAIENRKLKILLQPIIPENNHNEIIISRYKKQQFLNWFEHKL